MSLLYFAITLGILIGIHEWGHYIVARMNKIAVSDFAIGFGPEVLGWTNKHGTRFSLRIIPLGGYVKMIGHEKSDTHTDAERATGFAYKSPWQRMAVAAAGPAVNFIFAIVVLMGLGMAGKPVYQAHIGQVVAEAPAATAGVQAGDRIVAVGGTPARTVEEVSRLIREANGQPLTLTLSRADGTVTVEVTPDPQTGRIGIQYSGDYVLQDGMGPIEALSFGVERTWAVTTLIVGVVGDLITGQRGLDDMGGLISIGKAADETARTGLYVFLTFLAMMSINLAVMNLLPIPGLDGSHIVFTFLEGVGLKIPVKVMNAIFMMGFLFLIGLMILVNVYDVLRHL
jgi:regulator of sigma E protease